MTRNCTILIVDDHPAVRASLVDWLAAQFPGWRRIEAASAEAALDRVRSAAPDLVLMDVVLPGIDGIAAVAILKSIAPAVQVVMLSSHESQAYQDEAARAGASGYVFKREITSALAPMLRSLMAARGEDA